MEFAELVQSKKDFKSKKTLNVKQFESALSVKAVDIEKRTIRVLASNADLDRDGERILPEAFKNSLDIFKSNPVILAAHSHRLDSGNSPVVGRAINIWINEGLWVVIEFAKTNLAEEYWQLYRDGFQKAVSIGFAPLAWSDTNENGKSVRIFSAVELFEISLVAVGSNRAALSKSKQGKVDWLTDKKILDEIKKQNPDFEKDSNEFAECLLGVNEDGETAEIDEPGCGEQSGDSRFELAKTVHPQGNYEDNEFVRLVTKR
ncbi:MAG: HK97 family phage prohead protease [Phycisphaerae bacterium]|nr:HK97 family phage prohead protease [Phycisphaerae bacterium]